MSPDERAASRGDGSSGPRLDEQLDQRLSHQNTAPWCPPQVTRAMNDAGVDIGRFPPRSRRKAANVPAPEITEDSAALEFMRRHRDQLRFDHDVGAWFCWTGSHWRKEGTGLALEWMRQLARSLSEDATAKGRYRKIAFASGVEKFARSDRAFAVTAEFWDRDPMLLGTPGGTVELCTGALRASNPADAISKVTLVTPSETSDCLGFRAFLNDATGGDPELTRFPSRVRH